MYIQLNNNNNQQSIKTTYITVVRIFCRRLEKIIILRATIEPIFTFGKEINIFFLLIVYILIDSRFQKELQKKKTIKPTHAFSKSNQTLKQQCYCKQYATKPKKKVILIRHLILTLVP